MPRRGVPQRLIAKRRQVLRDPIFHSEVVGAFANGLMRHGKKRLAYRIMYVALNLVKDHFVQGGRVTEEIFQKTVDEKRELLGLAEKESLPESKIGLVVLCRSIENTRPHVEVRSSRIGGDTRQVPRALTSQRSQRLARRFMIRAALARRKVTPFKPGDEGMAKLLALEWMDAYDGKGGAVKMCTDMHRMAKANQAYVYTRPSTTQESLPI
jgi:small subunit ribosomal protein S7